MAKAQGHCIFCGGKGLTKEHVFPKWARNILASSATHNVSRISVSHISIMNTAVISPTLDERQGQLANKRLRVVCRNCNGGWMSKVESSAKSILTRLIKGEPTSLGEDEQQVISLWSCLRSAVFERDHLPTATLTQNEYDFIRLRLRPPENWRIYIGKNTSEEWNTRIFHIGAEANVIGFAKENRHNTQKTIIGMSNLVVVIVSSTARNAAFVVKKMSPNTMLQVWPYSSSIEWPPSQGIDTEYLREISYGTPTHM